MPPAGHARTPRPASDWAEIRRGGRFGAFMVLCLGIWLHAADSLLTTTVMPAVTAEIGGLAWVNWALALYELGSIVAGACTGLAARAAGLTAEGGTVLVATLEDEPVLPPPHKPDGPPVQAVRWRPMADGGDASAAATSLSTAEVEAQLAAAAAVFGVNSQAGSAMAGTKRRFLEPSNLPLVHGCARRAFGQRPAG